MSYSCTLTKVNDFLLRNAVKLLHFDFEYVYLCNFDIDLGMNSLSNKLGTIFLVV